jgi:hypothetical protein
MSVQRRFSGGAYISHMSTTAEGVFSIDLTKQSKTERRNTLLLSCLPSSRQKLQLQLPWRVVEDGKESSRLLNLLHGQLSSLLSDRCLLQVLLERFCLQKVHMRT